MPAPAPETPAGDAEQHPSQLLALPNFLLHEVLGRLTSAADLAAAAASCCALRELVHSSSWPSIQRLEAHAWKPALPCSLRWAAGSCPQLRRLDLSGAAACCDADLAPLSQLSSLTALSLEGLWQVTGSSRASGALSSNARRRSGAGAGGVQALDVLGPILGSNGGLLSLDLSGTAVPVGSALAAALAQLTAGAPNATKPAHGLQCLRLAGCQRAGGGGGQAQAMALREVLLECPALAELDVSGCRWVTAEALPQSGDALSLALALLPLRRASFAGCDLLHSVGWLLSSWEGLEQLELSGTAVDDGEVEQIAAGCTQLCSLSLCGCLRIKGPGLEALAASAAVQLGCLTELSLADLAWVGHQHLAPLLQALRSSGEAPVRLDLSSCGGLGDASLQALLPEPSTAGTSGSSSGFYLKDLRVAHSSRLTAAAVQQLAAATPLGRPLLHRLRLLDVSHVQSLGRVSSGRSIRGSGTSGGGSSSTAAVAEEASPAAQALAALLEAAGGSLHTAILDGCYAGRGLLPLLARSCPAVRQLSLVGCSGVGDADLAALTALTGLRDLAVGGASLAWHEHRALAGLRGLTRLRLARRTFLTDVQLAPLLAANRGSLVRLELAGCATLTDAALLALLPLPPQEQEQDRKQQHQGQQQQPRPPPQQQQDREQQPHEQAAGSTAPQRQQKQQRPPPPSLQHLSLVCCDRITGSTLRRLVRLRSLRLGGCPAVNGEALQMAAICCTQLTLLELPSHVPSGIMPVTPAGVASHLRGLRVRGGLDESGSSRQGGRGRRGSGGGGLSLG